MQSNSYFPNRYRTIIEGSLPRISIPRQAIIGGVLVLALISFELFNFDSTRYALDNLLGGVSFLGLSWAVILAVAFCAIDFAGLARIFTPEQGVEEPTGVWYLAGAWFLGATMNAIMTWWAVSLVLLNHTFGNEVLDRQQLLRYVPIFVAVLVWLTRILFIGAFAVAGDRLLRQSGAAGRSAVGRTSRPRPAAAPKRSKMPAAQMATSGPMSRTPKREPKRDPKRVPKRNPRPAPGVGRAVAPMSLSSRRTR